MQIRETPANQRRIIPAAEEYQALRLAEKFQRARRAILIRCVASDTIRKGGGDLLRVAADQRGDS
jgi:hypothetical protein